MEDRFAGGELTKNGIKIGFLHSRSLSACFEAAAIAATNPGLM